MLDECHEIDLRSTGRDHHGSPLDARFDRHEQIAGATAHVLVVLTQRTTQTHRQWPTAVRQGSSVAFHVMLNCAPTHKVPNMSAKLPTFE